jgi:hypothetical protein
MKKDKKLIENLKETYLSFLNESWEVETVAVKSFKRKPPYTPAEYLGDFFAEHINTQITHWTIGTLLKEAENWGVSNDYF